MKQSIHVQDVFLTLFSENIKRIEIVT